VSVCDNQNKTGDKHIATWARPVGGTPRGGLRRPGETTFGKQYYKDYSRG